LIPRGSFFENLVLREVVRRSISDREFELTAVNSVPEEAEARWDCALSEGAALADVQRSWCVAALATCEGSW